MKGGILQLQFISDQCLSQSILVAKMGSNFDFLVTSCGINKLIKCKPYKAGLKISGRKSKLWE